MRLKAGKKLPIALAALLICVLLLILANGILWVSGSLKSDQIKPTAIFQIIEAPTLTATFQPSATPDLMETKRAYEESGQIFVGGFVQITGTEGAGLRLRSGAGLNYSLLFLGYDSEVYEVKDGPLDADGKRWWYLVAPFDDMRSGWAASEYLSVVPASET